MLAFLRFSMCFEGLQKYLKPQVENIHNTHNPLFSANNSL